MNWSQKQSSADRLQQINIIVHQKKTLCPRESSFHRTNMTIIREGHTLGSKQAFRTHQEYNSKTKQPILIPTLQSQTQKSREAIGPIQSTPSTTVKRIAKTYKQKRKRR